MAWRAPPPWALAALGCAAAYGVLLASGQGHLRSEFLGASLLAGGAGALLLVLARLRSGWARWHAPGLFLLNWLFAAYLISVLAI